MYVIKKKLSKSDLTNIIKIYKLSNKNDLRLLLKNPTKILDSKLRKSFMKVLFYKNPIKVMEGYYYLYSNYKKNLRVLYSSKKRFQEVYSRRIKKKSICYKYSNSIYRFRNLFRVAMVMSGMTKIGKKIEKATVLNDIISRLDK